MDFHYIYTSFIKNVVYYMFRLYLFSRYFNVVKTINCYSGSLKHVLKTKWLVMLLATRVKMIY